MPHLKSKSTPQLKKKAIEVFNAWIRERDKEKRMRSAVLSNN